MKVNNRKCIYRMASRLLFSNKRRNLITIFAIILTAVLFTSLFTIMLSINASYENSMFRQLGGNEHGAFKDVTAVQKEKLIKHKNIKAYGERLVIGVIAEEPFKNQSAEISFMDANTTKWSFIELEAGHLPAARNEVIMDKQSLKLLGYEPVLGQSIELTFDIMGSMDEDRKYTDTFTLSGYWDFDPLCPAHYINVSKEYAEAFSPDTDLNVMLSSSVNAWNKMLEVIEDSGYSYGEKSSDTTIRIGVNPGYTSVSIGNDYMLETALPLAVFLLLVIFTGYLIIYNVFQISVANDIRFYGLLKTIGTTQKQVKRIIRLQALALSIVGIPLGLLLGFFLGSVLTPAVLGNTNISGKSLTISTSPVIFITAAFFEVITVLLSVSKPGRMAGKVSPIEALRFNDGVTGGKKKKATRGARTWQMAFANTERNKKKTILVFTSLALSLVILNTVNMFTGGFDSEKWLAKEMSTDFIVGKYSYFKFQGAKQDSITEVEIDAIKEKVNATAGGIAYSTLDIPLMQVNEEKHRKYRETQADSVSFTAAENGKFYLDCFIEGMDDYLIDKLTVYEGDLSLLKDPGKKYIALITHRYSNGEYELDEYAPAIGDKIALAEAAAVDFVDTRTGQPATDSTFAQPEFLGGSYTGITEYEYTVCAYVEVPLDLSLRASSLGYNVIVSPDNLKADFGENALPIYYAFDTETPESEEKAENFLHQLSLENSGITYESKAIKRSEFEDFKNMFILLGGVLCLIIGFVGILNFFNTVMAGIIARKNEIAVLQAIGMTGKQVKEMLIIEGLIYTVGSGLLALVLSLIFIPAVNGIGNSIFWFYSAHFSIRPVVLMLPLMALFGLLVPLLSYKGLSKASIVERIREIG